MERKHVAVLPSTVPLDQKTDPPRFLRLPHPRTRERALWLPHIDAQGRDGLLEVQRVDPGENKARSYFVEQEVLSDGTLSLFTPFDPAFLLIALLAQLPPHFLPLDELVEAASTASYKGVKREEAEEAGESMDDEGRDCEEDIVRLGKLPCVAGRLLALCETTEHDSTTLYRFSPTLALDLIKTKITKLTDPITGLFGAYVPVTEEVKPAVTEREEVKAAGTELPTVWRGFGRDGGLGLADGHSEELQLEARQKSAISIVANYLPPAFAQTLAAAYPCPLLTAHLSTYSAPASAVLAHTYLPGRASALNGTRESDNALGGGNAALLAKKKKEAQKGSRGVEALKKVNTSGMKSLKDMFAKAPPKKK